MPFAFELEDRVYKVEGFQIEIDCDVDQTFRGYPRKLADVTDTVATWRRLFLERYPSIRTVDVFKGTGVVANGNMQIERLIRTYELKSIHQYIDVLTEEIRELEDQINRLEEPDIETKIKHACHTLGISNEDLSTEVIRSARRKMISIFSPDRIQHLVDDKKIDHEYLIYANNRTANINTSYDLLREYLEKGQVDE